MAMDKIGIIQRQTNVSFHPKYKAQHTQSIVVDMKLIHIPTFSPIPSWILLRSLN